MNSVYIDTASRIYAGLVAAKRGGNPAMGWDSTLARESFEYAEHFMKEYKKRVDEERMVIQKTLQEHPGAVVGQDFYEPPTRER